MSYSPPKSYSGDKGKQADELKATGSQSAKPASATPTAESVCLMCKKKVLIRGDNWEHLKDSDHPPYAKSDWDIDDAKESYRLWKKSRERRQEPEPEEEVVEVEEYRTNGMPKKVKCFVSNCKEEGTMWVLFYDRAVGGGFKKVMMCRDCFELNKKRMVV